MCRPPADSAGCGVSGLLCQSGLVVSDVTGFTRDYRSDPYARYTSGDTLMFDVTRLDTRHPPKTSVIGLRLAGREIAGIPPGDD